ncbi:hypothetical protein JCM10914_4207 [Paenibacillus sp. JCM 10914]|nr:hypothetical protein JCM10914_4207 [Paenibacillus sp. JCM 10914]
MGSFRFIHAADLHLDSPFVGISGLTDSLRLYIQDSTFRRWTVWFSLPWNSTSILLSLAATYMTAPISHFEPN